MDLAPRGVGPLQLQSISGQTLDPESRNLANAFRPGGGLRDQIARRLPEMRLERAVETGHVGKTHRIGHFADQLIAAGLAFQFHPAQFQAALTHPAHGRGALGGENFGQVTRADANPLRDQQRGQFVIQQVFFGIFLGAFQDLAPSARRGKPILDQVGIDYLAQKTQQRLRKNPRPTIPQVVVLDHDAVHHLFDDQPQTIPNIQRSAQHLVHRDRVRLQQFQRHPQP